MSRSPPNSCESLSQPAHPSQSPPSDSTETSHFTDSDVDMSKSEAQSVRQANPPSEISERLNNLSTRLEQLAIVVCEAEEGRRLSESRITQLHTHLNKFERGLADEADFEESLDVVDPLPEQVDDASVEQPLKEVLNHLYDTIASMRLRQQEHLHLHQLSRDKLEAVAQRCLVQETQLLELNGTLDDLRNENRTLGAENDTLLKRVEMLETKAARREVVVGAMTSAVAGLEGWIESATPNKGDSIQSPSSRKTARRSVIRGRGRFRGKYYIDDHDDGGSSRHTVDVGSEAKDLHDGVKAWLRGFKDVEEEARSDRTRMSKEGAEDSQVIDDWGDFEVAA